MSPNDLERVESLCLEALSKDAPDRAAFLEAACGADAALRREVESILAARSEAGEFLEAPPWAAGAAPLPPGTRLGPYEIDDLIGAGGMGEVYKARDTRLDRAVAIKVLPSAVTADPKRRARFQREAKTIASLNHPHICTLHDVGDHDGSMFLVMELLEGESLAARLRRGALPLGQALGVGIDVAEALAAAHRAGVVHRDLKPGNVMLTKTGAKLLDFGLAKLRASGLVSGLLSRVTTNEESATAEGTILGTLPYMAPEQLDGREADARSDIWAMGCVLFELVAGRAPFEGGSSASLISAIMTTEPPPLALRVPQTPPGLEHVVRSCIAKDPDARWQSAADVGQQLGWVRTLLTASEPDGIGRRRRVGRRAIVAWTAVVLGVAAAGIAGLTWLGAPWRGPVSPEAHVVRAEISAGLDAFNASVAVSPDGRLIAYIGQVDGRRRILLRALDVDEALPVPETEDALYLRFSPDSKWLAFSVAGALKRVLMPKGPAEVIVSNLNTAGAPAWGLDDTIVYPADRLGTWGLFRIPAKGGTPPSLVMEADRARGEWWLGLPEVLPDGRTLLVTTSDATDDGTRVVAQSVNGGKSRTVLEGASGALYVPTGHLVFRRGRRMLVVPFDAARAEPLGDPVPLDERVAVPLFAEKVTLALSGSGLLAYVPSDLWSRPTERTVWVDRAGRELPAVTQSGRGAFGARLSPNGRRVAWALDMASPHVAVVELDRNVTTRLSNEATTWWPIWSPDGTRVAFTMFKKGYGHVFWQRADANGPAEELTSGPYFHQPRAFTPNGRELIYQQDIDPQTGFDIWAVALEHGATPRPLLRGRVDEFHASLSRDGRWMAYVSEESGQPEVYVKAFPFTDERWKVSAEGGLAPVWSRDGREIYYQYGQAPGWTSRVYAVRVDTTSGFRPDPPRILFEGPSPVPDHYGQSFDVSPDGQRFLVNKVELPSPPTQIHLVFNWFETLRTERSAAKQ